MVSIWVIPTDEERIVASHALELIASGSRRSANPSMA